MRILTLTANLLAETTVDYTAWHEGATVRAVAGSFQVGGKGVNTSRMLRRLGVDTEALCFPGGFTGARCEAWLRAAGLPFRAFATEQETRAGWVVRAPGRPETTFLGTDNHIDAAAVSACAQALDEASEPTCLAVCGSVPGWDDSCWEPLRDALRRWAPVHPLAVDTYGPPLAWMAALPCALVKINRKEFAGLTGDAESSLDDAGMERRLAAIAAQRPVRRWIVTDGPRAVWSIERGAAPVRVVPPRIHEVSPTGSGDVFFAAVLEALFVRGRPLHEAVAFALPLAAANAASPGVADFDLTPFGLRDRRI
jgi:fructose-1-phosphate kinase PfkB-like protein